MSDLTTRIRMTEDASSKLRQIASAGQQAISTMKNVGQSVDNAFKTNAPDQFASRAGSAMNNVASDAESLGAAIDSMCDGFDSFSTAATGSLSGTFRTAASDAGEFADALGEAGENAEDLSDAAEETGKTIDEMGKSGLDDLKEDAREAGEEFENTGRKASALKALLVGIVSAVSVAAIGHQIGDFVGDSINVGKEYTATMSEVQAISGATGAELEQLSDTAREYGATTVFSASQSGEALKYMALAGWDAQQSTDALGGVLNLAAASGMELGQASDMVTDYLSAFGMAADQAGYFADMLTYAQGHSNTSTMQLGQAFLNSAAIMNSAGQDVETTTSLIEAMANQGTKGARAGTQLAAMMRDITNSMEDGHIMIGDTAVAVQDAYGNFRDLTDILFDVESAVDGLGTADRAAALSATFTADSTRGLNQILTEGVDKIAGYEEALRGSAGTAQLAADTMTDNLTGDLANMNSAYEEMQLQVYEGIEEPLRGAVQMITSDVIPALTEWVPQALGGAINVLSKAGSALVPVINTILKNPEAVGTAFKSIGAGFLAFKGIGLASNIADAASGTGELTGALGKLAGVIIGNPWAVGAAAVAGGVVAIAAAVDKYNDLQISENLTEHFGDISLDTDQISELASSIVPVDITAELQLSNVSFDEAEKLVEQAEDLLEQNSFVNWKVANITGTLPEEDGSLVLQNTQSFVDSVTDAIEKEEYAAELAINATLADGSDKTQIISQLQDWFKEDQATAEQLGSAVTTMVEDAINEGAYNVNTAAAASIIQQKMLDMVNGAKEAELAGKMKWIEQEAGLAALDAESWKGVVEDIAGLQQELMDAESENYMGLFGLLEQRAYNDPSRRGAVDSIEELLQENYSNLSSATLTQSWGSMFGSLSEAYSEEMEAGKASLNETTAGWVDNMLEQLQVIEDGGDFSTSFYNMLNSTADITGGLGKADRGALADRFEAMLPTVDMLRDAIDNSTGPIPQALMESYQQALQVGAMGGDEGSIAGVVAQQLAAEFGDRGSFDSALAAAGFDISNLTTMFGETFEDELNRAFSETTDVDFSGLTEKMAEALTGENVDWTQVEAILNEYGLTISEGLAEQGIDLTGEVPVNTDDMQINTEELMHSLEGMEGVGTQEIDGELYVNYKVLPGNTLSGIAAENGLSLDQILADNPEITNPDAIDVDQIIRIRAADVEVDASGAGEQAAAETQQETQEAMEEPFEVTGTAAAEIDQTNNADEVYNGVGDDMQGRFNTAYQISGSAHVSITVDYSIANPSATISLGGDGSGTGTVTATIAGHAEGGYFDSPHLAMIAEGGYGEWIIPNDGSDEARAMVLNAGEALGLIDQPIGVMPETGGGSEGQGTQDNHRVIDLNINGTGGIQVSSGMSKEDIVAIIQNNIKGVLLNIVEQEILEEGDMSYEW